MAYLAGAIVSRVSFVFPPMRLGPFDFYLTSPALLLMMWSAIRIAIRSPEQRCWIVSGVFFATVGIVCDQFAYLLLRVSRTCGPYSGSSIVGSIVLGVGVLGMTFFLLRRSRESRDRIPTDPVSFAPAIAFTVIQIAMILAFRGTHALFLHLEVPNAARSLIVGGIELHHIVFGVVLVIAGSLAAVVDTVSRRLRVWNFLILALGVALISDQWLYYSYRTVNDVNYGSLPSVASASCLSLLASLFCLREVRHRRRENANGPAIRESNS